MHICAHACTYTQSPLNLPQARNPDGTDVLGLGAHSAAVRTNARHWLH